MRLVCAWCGVAIARAGYEEKADTEASHGMCPACSASLLFQERGASLPDYLDTIPIPVLLLDDKNVAVTMNIEACASLGRQSADTRIPLFGKVFDCIFSRSSEGCGRTVHCSGCVIRRSVTETFNSGKSQVLIPAALRATSPDKLSAAVLAVTTVKIAGLVLLRLD